MLALIVFGMNNELELIGPVNFPCPNCNYTPTNLAWSHRKATVYFIPLFGMGKSYALTCDHCGLQTGIDQQLGEELQRSLSAPVPPATGVAAPAGPHPSAQPHQAMPAGQPTRALSPPAAGGRPGPVSFGSAAPAPDNERTQRLPPDLLPGPPGGSVPVPVAAAATTTCARCRADVPAGAQFCQSCGAAIETPLPRVVRTCQDCGFLQTAGQFCNHCGKPLPPA
ncbi:MAG TPA: zinc-ribbon domain-containing protein [Chloroflexia bacterium]|nr:zinc-ribbon domain-containing protein [Chloroflexia bacterium]